MSKVKRIYQNFFDFFENIIIAVFFLIHCNKKYFTYLPFYSASAPAPFGFAKEFRVLQILQQIHSGRKEAMPILKGYILQSNFFRFEY